MYQTHSTHSATHVPGIRHVVIYFFFLLFLDAVKPIKFRSSFQKNIFSFLAFNFFCQMPVQPVDRMKFLFAYALPQIVGRAGKFPTFAEGFDRKD